MRQCQRLLREDFAVNLISHTEFNITQRAIPVAVFHLQNVGLRSLKNVHRAKHLFVFAQTRPRTLIGVNQTIHAEVIVVRVIAIIATVLVTLATLFVMHQ
ncbi:hypothetical protein D3C75_857090 [compost metagenome]